MTDPELRQLVAEAGLPQPRRVKGSVRIDVVSAGGWDYENEPAIHDGHIIFLIPETYATRFRLPTQIVVPLAEKPAVLKALWAWQARRDEWFHQPEVVDLLAEVGD